MEEHKGNLIGRTLTGLKWAFLSSVIRAVLSLAVISLLAHLLKPEDFGLMGIALIFIEFAKRLSTLGIGPAIIHIKELSPELVRAGFTFSLVMGVALFGVMWLAAPGIERYFDSEHIRDVIRIISISIIIGNCGVISRSLLMRKLTFKQITMGNIFSYIAGYGLVGIPFALLGMGVWSLVAALLTAAVISVIMFYCYSPHSLKPLFSKKEFLKLINFGGGITLGKVFIAIARQGDNFVVGKLLGINSLGFYNRASHLTNLPVTHISETLSRVLL